MEWYWNEFVYIGIWIAVLFFGLGAAVYAMITKETEEGFQDQSIDIQSFVNQYNVKEICDVFSSVYEAEINAERANGTSERPESEARERANANLKRKILGGPLQCPFEISDSEDLVQQHKNFMALPSTLLITIASTLVYSVVNLQMSYNKIVKTMKEAEKARVEAFEDICSPEQAAEKRKTQCKLPEELTPEEKQALELKLRQEIQQKKQTMINELNQWRTRTNQEIQSSKDKQTKELQSLLILREMIRKKNKEAGEDLSKEDEKKQEQIEEKYQVAEETLSYLTYYDAFLKTNTKDLLEKAKVLKQKIEVLKKKLEAGDTTLPQESFLNYFDSPLH